MTRYYPTRYGIWYTHRYHNLKYDYFFYSVFMSFTFGNIPRIETALYIRHTFPTDPNPKTKSLFDALAD